jgi:hypothetical protein
MRVEFYPVIGGPEDIPVCKYVNLRCILARGDQRNCAPGETCKKRLLNEGYKLAGDTWACKSCGMSFGSNVHALSCGIGGPGAK